ncbi:MAG TPA: hypothetical protein VLK33_18575 [Terriglobales bacterium]|nr:hypothetical protein [Terriglobales bacterium]
MKRKLWALMQIEIQRMHVRINRFDFLSELWILSECRNGQREQEKVQEFHGAGSYQGKNSPAPASQVIDCGPMTGLM